jgi:hypothetical protein
MQKNIKEENAWNIGPQEEFEDTMGVIRIRISKKNRQHIDKKKKYKRINDLQNIQ